MKTLEKLSLFVSGFRIGFVDDVHVAEVIYDRNLSPDCPNYEHCPVKMMFSIRKRTSRLRRVIRITLFLGHLFYILWGGTAAIEDTALGDR